MHIANASETAQRLLGITPTPRSITWIPTYFGRISTLADDINEDDLPDIISEDDCPSDVDANLDSDQTILSDILADDDFDSSQINGPDDGRTSDIGLVWMLPVSELVTTFIADRHIPLQRHIRADPFEDIVHHFDINDDVLPPDIERVCPRQEGFVRFDFEARDIAILTSTTARLNDVCINGCAVVLYRYISSLDATHAQRCAILSTFELVRIRNNAADANIWRNIRHTLYWLKSTWILPIHRTKPVGHWVLAVIYTDTNEVHLFDSLAGRRAWQHDINVSPVFLYYP
jgi:hypothetical protein